MCTLRHCIRRIRAFTLVELLVVVGLIAALIAILLPTFARSRRQARAVVCLSNLRQSGNAFHMYVNENRGRAPINYGSHENYWGRVLSPFLHGADAVLYCPEATENIGYPALDNTSAYIGTASHAWAQISVVGAFRYQSSYAMNGWMSALRPNQSIPMGEPAREMYITLPCKQSDIVPLIGDGATSAAYPLHTDSVPSDLRTPVPTRGNAVAEGMHVFCMARHGRAINIVFLDGHARRVPLEELWQLKWHRHFEPRVVTLPPE